jgi:hypothetical protein
MMTQDSIQIDNLFPIPPPDQLEHPFEVEGQGTKVLPGLWFTGFWDFPHCYTTLPTSEVDPTEQIVLSPNPVSTYLNLLNYSELEIMAVRINNLAGQTVLSYTPEGEVVKVSLEGLTFGFYFVQIILENGKTVTKRIIKL